MQTFVYKARDPQSGKVIKSEIKAESELAAGRMLNEMGYVPIDIVAEDESQGLLSKLTGRITMKDRLVFTRQLATLVGAGLPISQSLNTVLEQTTNARMRRVVNDVITSIEAGKSLSDSFGTHPEVFDQLYIALVTSGEASGTLDQALLRIADQQEKDAELMSKVKSAMTYPAIVLVVIGLVMAFMMFSVMPEVKKLYDDMRLELPMITKIMVGLSEFLVNFWWLMLIFIGMAVYFVIQYFSTDGGILVKDNLKLNFPLFNKLFRKLYMGRFTRTGQTLLSTGVPMLDALEITAQAVNNVVVEKSIVSAAEKVKGGKALSVAVKDQPYIELLVPQMIRIGEQSGKIDEMMGKAAKIFEDELDAEIKALSTMIEPMLMVFLAVVAGGMVGAILLPIYGMVNNVNI